MHAVLAVRERPLEVRVPLGQHRGPAVDVVGRDALVAGSVGPLVAPTHDVARPDPATVRSVFAEQIDGLLEGGVDLFVVETFGDLDHLRIAIEVIRAACDLPIVAEMTFGEELVAIDGTTPEAAATALTLAGADAIGVNCGVGPIACLDAVGGDCREILDRFFCRDESYRTIGEALERAAW